MNIADNISDEMNVSDYFVTKWTCLQVACVAQIKAVFWSKGVENIFVENPETHFQVLESMEGYWIGNFNF